MRKQFIDAATAGSPAASASWLDLERLAQVGLTSEDPERPIEAALRGEAGVGWRASGPGPQLIQLSFDRPQQLRRIRLVFQEDQQGRTQEFVLRWSADGGQTYQDVVRQQYTFNPSGSTREEEEYHVDLAGVTVLTLQITPDIGGGPARASLAALQLM